MMTGGTRQDSAGENAGVRIGIGQLAGKGVFATREFAAGEVVIKYSLAELTRKQYELLPQPEKRFTHHHDGKCFLYGEPERYVNGSPNPNTAQDFDIEADVAIKEIKKGDPITTNPRCDDQN